jgi:hypothetical protein
MANPSRLSIASQWFPRSVIEPEEIKTFIQLPCTREGLLSLRLYLAPDDTIVVHTQADASIPKAGDDVIVSRSSRAEPGIALMAQHTTCGVALSRNDALDRKNSSIASRSTKSECWPNKRGAGRDLGGDATNGRKWNSRTAAQTKVMG